MCLNCGSELRFEDFFKSAQLSGRFYQTNKFDDSQTLETFQAELRIHHN